MSTWKHYNVRGTENNVNTAINELEKTNRCEIDANKETKLMEWQVQMKKTQLANAENMSRIANENECRMAEISSNLKLDLHKAEEGMTADHRFQLENSKIKNNTALWQQKLGADHLERMKAMEIDHEQTMGAMNIRGNFAMTALGKAKGNFAMKNSALDFKPVNNAKKQTRKSLKHRQALPLTHEEIKPSDLEENKVVEEEKEESDNVEASNLYEEFSFDIDDEHEKEKAKMDHELELERIKLETKQVELEKLSMINQMK